MYSKRCDQSADKNSKELTGDSAFISLVSDSSYVVLVRVVDVTWRRFQSTVVELVDDLITLVTWQSVPVRHYVFIRTGQDCRQTAHLTRTDTIIIIIIIIIFISGSLARKTRNIHTSIQNAVKHAYTIHIHSYTVTSQLQFELSGPGVVCFLSMCPCFYCYIRHERKLPKVTV